MIVGHQHTASQERSKNKMSWILCEVLAMPRARGAKRSDSVGRGERRWHPRTLGGASTFLHNLKSAFIVLTPMDYELDF